MSNDELLEALRKAAGRSMSAEEIRAQRLSFVLSTLDDSSEATRQRVERQLDAHEGNAA